MEEYIIPVILSTIGSLISNLLSIIAIISMTNPMLSIVYMLVSMFI